MLGHYQWAALSETDLARRILSYSGNELTYRVIFLHKLKWKVKLLNIHSSHMYVFKIWKVYNVYDRLF